MLRTLPIEQRLTRCSVPTQTCRFCGSELRLRERQMSPELRGERNRVKSIVARAEQVNASTAQTTQETDPNIVPFGYHWYETMILLRSDLDAEKRDVELAKFEAFLKKEGAVNIDALVRANSQALAYPIKGFWDGIYVLYTYAANPQTVRRAQKVLSTPAVGEESNILRHMTFRQ